MPWRPLLEVCREVERLSVRLNPAATKELKLFFANRLGIAVGQISDNDLSRVIKSTTLQRPEGAMVHAAREMLWLASGRRSADGKREVIRPDRWAFLTLDIEHQAARDLDGKVVYADLKGAFGNDLTEEEWQEVELGLAPPKPTPDLQRRRQKAKSSEARRRSGRKKGSGSFASQDAPLLKEMKDMIEGKDALSVWAAAMKVANNAAGAGTPESKGKRLAKRYQKWIAEF